MNFTQIFLLFVWATLMFGDLCPDTSQWSLTAKANCNTTHSEYYCMYDENRQHYVATCKQDAEYQRPGYKFVIRGGLDGKLCDENHFQPIKFWTNGSSECIFLKSDCSEEGQIISNKGNSTSDVTCTCDYTRGYVFVTNPINGCSCFPGQQDCSCYRKLCELSEILSPDYDCIRFVDWTGHFKCPSIEAQISRLTTVTPSTPVTLEDAVKGLADVYRFYSIFVLIAGIILILSIVVIYKNYTTSQARKHAAFKLCLKKFYKDIIKTIKHEEIVEYLIETGTLDMHDCEHIEAAGNQLRKNHLLFTLICDRGENAYNKFLSALRHLGCYENLLNRIEKTGENVYDEQNSMLKELEEEETKEKYKTCLRINYKDIVSTINYDTIVNYLINKKVLCDSDRKQVETCLGLTKRNHKLLEIIWSRGAHAYNEFISALRNEDSYVALADKIVHSGELDVHLKELEEEQISTKMRAQKHVAFKSCLKKHYNDIIKTIKHGEIVKYLIETGALDKREFDRIEAAGNQLRKNHQLLTLIWDQGENTYQEFLSALRHLGCYENLLKQIEETEKNDNDELGCMLKDLEKEEMKVKYKTCLKLNYKDIVMTINYKTIVDYLITQNVLCDADRKKVETGLGLTKRNHKLLEIIWSRGAHAYNEFITALKKEDSCVKLADKIVHTDVDINEELEAKLTELEEEQNENIPKKTREIHHQHLAEWIKEDTTFIPTNTMKKVEKQLQNYNCVLLAGRSGNGKSSIIRHIALRMWQEEGFDVIPIVMGPSDIGRYYDPQRKQLFVIDDFCGKDRINVGDIDIWASQITEIQELIESGLQSVPAMKFVNKRTVKLLIACKEQICEDQHFKPLRILDKYKLNLSDLTEKEKSEMISMYAQNCGKEELKFDQAYYPLLCRLCTGKTPTEIKKLFQEPYICIKDNLKRMKQDDYLQFFVITVCTLFDNEIKTEWFKDTPPNKKDAMQYILDEFNLNLNNELTLRLIIEQLDTTKMTYMSKTGNVYHFIHKDIYDIASFVCGETYTSLFIDHASGFFIGERYCLETQSAGNYQHTSKSSEKTDPRFQKIILNKEYTERYLNRLVKDLKNGNTYSSLHNSQLESDSYRRIFCTFCRGNRAKLEDIFKQFKQSEKATIPVAWHTQYDNNASSDNWNKPDDDYINLKSVDFFRSYKTLLPLIEAAWEGFPDIVELLIEMNLDLNDTDRFGRSAVFVASLRGKEKVVRLLVDKNADIFLCDNKSRSPLYAACDEGHRSIVEFLVSKNADVSKCDTEGRASLHVSCAGGHKEIAELLLQQNKSLVNKGDIRGQTPLFYAVAQGRRPVVDLLIQYKANVNECDKEGCSPLYIACKEGYDNIIKIMLDNNADVLKCDSQGKSPLLIACYEGKTKTVELVAREIEARGKYIDQCDNHGRSPLYIACEKGNCDIVQILLLHRSKVNICDRQKRSPLYVACKWGHLKIVKLLVDKQAEMFQCNQWQDSPLHVACREGHTQVVKYLISKNADVSRRNERGILPLHVSCEEGRPEIVKLLLKANRNLINECDQNKRTPLHYAALRGHKSVVQILIDNNAKYSKDKNGQLPQTLAIKQGHGSIVDLLQVDWNTY